MRSNNYSKDMSLFFSGLGAGVAIALLFAPKSGEQTRADIRDTLLDVKEKAMEHKSGLRDSLKQTKEQVSAAMDAGREAYRSAASRVSREAEDAMSNM
jgi:gas vesicle protein